MDNLSTLKADGHPRLFNLHAVLVQYSLQAKVVERRKAKAASKLREEGQQLLPASRDVAKPRKSAMKRSSMLPMQPPSAADY
jgi:hypothetical protein